MRANYWSCSKFAKWIRSRFAGVKKPNSATIEEWHYWKKTFSQSHPFVYWFTEDFLNDAQEFVNYPLDKLEDFSRWGYNKFISKPHFLDTKLKRGEYYDIDTRILHGLFETLVDFVEVELAWMHVVFDERAQKEYNHPWFKRIPILRRALPQWRCPEAGIAHLEWEMSLTNDCEWMSDEERSNTPECGQPSNQATIAKEVYDLYHWWKNVRPSRPDPYEESGWSDFCDGRRADNDDNILFSDKTDEEREETRQFLDALNKVEINQNKEDEDMMIRLIKVRRGLWT